MIDLLYKFDKANMPNLDDDFFEEAKKKYEFEELEDLGETAQYNVRAFMI